MGLQKDKHGVDFVYVPVQEYGSNMNRTLRESAPRIVWLCNHLISPCPTTIRPYGSLGAVYLASKNDLAKGRVSLCSVEYKMVVSYKVGALRGRI